MNSETWELRQVFENRKQYRVPYYQRGYAWVIDQQWERLWSDIEEKAEARLEGERGAAHFFGAIVVEPQKREGTRGIEIFHVVDGQQRLTTLQFVFKGIRLALHALGLLDSDELLDTHLVNGGRGTMKDPDVEVFKVWPTHQDRASFKAAMTATSLADLRVRFSDHYTNAGSLLKHGLHPPALAAVEFFARKTLAFVQDGGDIAGRAEAVVDAVLTDFKLVEIMLTDGDDAQVIFETLNGQGAKLNAIDLVRNFIFMRADREDTAELAHELYETMWTRFETLDWKIEDKRGRLTKPRLEWMVQSVLQVETQREVEVSRLYAEYRAFCLSPKTALSGANQLALLNRYADHYEALVTGNGDRPIARFGARLVNYDVTTIYPLALQISLAGLSHADTRAIFDDLISYVVRRVLCGLTPKNYNNVFMAALRHLAKEGITRDNLLSYLRAQTADTARWPTDGEVRQACLTGDIFYGRLQPKAARQLLTEVEAVIRAGRRTEEPELPKLVHLDVDHIMPRSWYEHWPLTDTSFVAEDEATRAKAARLSGEALSTRQQEILSREDATPTLGNISLLNYSVNRSAQNKNFETKKQLVIAATNLSLNIQLLGEARWDVEQIQARGERLARILLELYASSEERLASPASA